MSRPPDRAAEPPSDRPRRRTASRVTSAVRTVLAALVLVALLAGIPAAFVSLLGSPMPGLQDLMVGDVSDRALVAALTTLTLVAWVQFALAVFVEALRLLTHLPMPRNLPGVLPTQQHLAQAMVAAVFALTPAVNPLAHAQAASATVQISAPADPTPTTARTLGADATQPGPDAVPSAPQRAPEAITPATLNAARPVKPSSGPVITYTVTAQGPGTFWDLATTFLGTGERWNEIWQLNDGRQQADGTVLTRPGFLRPGWTILVPAPDTPDATALARPHGGDEPHPQAQPAPELRTASLVGNSLGAGAGLLAAASLIALLRWRRQQFRERRPGRTIATTSPSLAPMEKALTLQGSAFLNDVRWLDSALRDLATRIGTTGTQLPDVLAARLGADVLELVLTPTADRPAADLPAPWTRDDTTGRWHLHRQHHPPHDSAQRPYQFPPYPTLVSLGYTDNGDYWLLDLERAGAVTLTGDRDRCLDLARFLANDLAHNIWSEHIDVTMAGLGAESTSSERITYAADAAQAVTTLRARLHRDVEALGHGELDDVLQARQTHNSDAWFPSILILNDTDPVDPDTTHQLRALTTHLQTQPYRRSVALVVIDGGPSTHPNDLRIDADGRLYVPALDLTLHAQQLSTQDARHLNALLFDAATRRDQPMPPAPGDSPWEALSDAAGAIRPELTTPRTDPTDPHSPTGTALTGPGPSRPPGRHAHPGPVADPASVLAQPIASLLATTATTAADIHTLAPSIPDTTRHRVQHTDPTLAADLAAWNAPDTTRPRLSLLGPLLVRSIGTLPRERPRVPWHTEVVTYLAAHPRGVTAEQMGSDLWPGDPEASSKSKLRQAVYLVRAWLGKDPLTDQPYLPNAPDANTGGIGLYRIDGLISDADLFRRLRLHGTAHGPEGISYLEAALKLVTGPPLHHRRHDGYTWLTDTPINHQYTAMIVDAAHLVATHHLATGRPDLAARAAHISLQAESHDDVPLLDLVAACDAQGFHSEAETWIKRILVTNDADVEEDLPPRTYEILRRRRWLHPTS